ncbi:immunoreactive 84kD antigen PG93 [Formosa agariphila KMM 3901]|uniref:Immunoreactive 84kD antigen PG93 n=1 Tax=Formosa agariphila (strain DSM 15362 / KCTC 12365 / LMG 23005 / KMM 3901 / M-2Alg 35-1) TaxID=1347342 RepID=T2KSA1_FORAG|nr:two-component regulator propeller domain-containing protein [Formosa agariphila]CDF81059.1 immunoreactive 84kD antigen PG93 [Formosa agariphila KMM 3901]
MFKRILLVILLVCPLITMAQDYTESWEGHFSYINIIDVTASETKIYAASENAVFSYDIQSQEISTLSTIQGLSGELISTVHYSDNFKALVIGYENGLIEIFLEDDTNVLHVVDIVDKPTIPPTNKRINHINEYEGVLYISTNYGISVYNLSRLEFGDTYFIGDSGVQTIITQTTVSNGYIWASGLNATGIKRAELSNTDLIDYNQWTKISLGNYTSVQAVSDNVYATNTNREIFRIENNSNLNRLKQFPSDVLDVKSANNELVITTANLVYLYDDAFRIIAQVGANDSFNTSYTSAISTIDHFYIGSNSLGVLQSPIGNASVFEDIYPNGPLLNIPFSVQAGNNNAWVTYGDYTVSYNPAPVKRYGISHLKSDVWNNIPTDSVLGATNLNAISVNPNKISQVYISSFNEGILEVESDVAVKLFNETNSGLETVDVPGSKSVRASASTFDNNGLLWSLSSLVLSPLKSYDLQSNQWKSYSFEGLYSDPINDELGFSDIAIDNAGIAWMGAYFNGLIGYDYKSGTSQIKSLNEESQNMPDKTVTALALDNRNQLWIGTPRGLRVLYNTSSFFTDPNVEVSEIIVLDNGIASELLSQEYITSIEVDGSNNKWIGTIGSGIFYFSSDGQETIYHFTKDNSPLPSNNITDISIDNSNGKVFIGTESGLLAFNSGSSGTKDNYSDAYVYPNPVRPTFNITDDLVKIKGLTDNVNIKITDIEGNLVAEAQANVNSRYGGANLEIDGGTAFWNGKNLANNVVRSGVYLIMLSDTDTFETKVLKLMIIR